jgi:cytochrome c oxidase cbb3-type subunit 3
MRMQALGMGILGVAALAAAAPAFADGGDVFRTNCASCHGKDGKGQPYIAPALKGDAFVTGSKAEDIQATIENGRSGDQKHYKDIKVAMPAWKGKLSDADIQAVIAFLQGDLQK